MRGYVAFTFGLLGIFTAMPAEPAELAEAGDSRESGTGSYIEEIIVTAEFVQKSVQKTPIAMTAMDQRSVEQFGLSEFDDLSLLVPSLSRTAADLVIRGVGRNFRSLGGDVGVPIYYDGIYSEEAIAQGSENRFYDLERIEVLRGPQGTLYGRNAIGGVINYVTNRPTRDWFAEVRGRGGAYRTNDWFGVVSGPLVRDRLLFRLVGSSVYQGADRKSKAAPGQEPFGDTGRIEDSNLALTLEYLPNDNIDIVLRGNYRYLRSTPREPLLIGEGTGDRTRRSASVCSPEGVDCFEEELPIAFVFPVINPNAHQSLPINGDGYGRNLENEAYPDFKSDYGYKVRTGTLNAEWRFGFDRYALRFVGGYGEAPWTTYKRNWGAAPGGRNRCLPPRCEPGPGGEQVSAYQPDADNGYRSHSGELQLITNWDGPANLVAGLYYLQFERELYFELSDPFHLGSYTVAPSYGSFLDRSCCPPSRGGPGRYDDVPSTGEVNLFGGSPRGTAWWFDSELDVDAYAVYSQVSYAFSEQLELTAGLRWSWDRKRGREWRWFFYEVPASAYGLTLGELNALMTTDPVTGEDNGDPLRFQGLPLEIIDNLELEDTWDEPTWRLALTWQPTRRTMAYLSATTGYRSGGFNLGLHQVFSYAAETVLSYEAGLKTDLLDGAIRINASAYYYDYENQQVSANQYLPASLLCEVDCTGDLSVRWTLRDAVTNVPQSTAWGTELEAIWRATPTLTLGLMHSYLRTEITSDFIIDLEGNFWSEDVPLETFGPEPRSSETLINTKGNELNRAPRHKLTAWGSYSVPLGDRGTLSFLASYAYVDAQYHNVLNYRINRAPAYERWDVRASWDSPRGKYHMAAYVKNLTDELGILEIRTAPNVARIADTTAPLYWGFEFRVRFGSWTERGLRSLDSFDSPQR